MLFLASARTAKRKSIRKYYVLLAALPILVKRRAEPGYNKMEKETTRVEEAKKKKKRRWGPILGGEQKWLKEET